MSFTDFNQQLSRNEVVKRQSSNNNPRGLERVFRTYSSIGKVKLNYEEWILRCYATPTSMSLQVIARDFTSM